MSPPWTLGPLLLPMLFSPQTLGLSPAILLPQLITTNRKVVLAGIENRKKRTTP
jgi:hypothetical protein